MSTVGLDEAMIKEYTQIRRNTSVMKNAVCLISTNTANMAPFRGLPHTTGSAGSY